MSKMCQILGMLQFIQVFIIRLFVMKNSEIQCMGVHSNYNELHPVRNDVYHGVCATSVRTVFCIQPVGSNQSFIPPGSVNRVYTSHFLA